MRRESRPQAGPVGRRYDGENIRRITAAEAASGTEAEGLGVRAAVCAALSAGLGLELDTGDGHAAVNCLGHIVDGECSY